MFPSRNEEKIKIHLAGWACEHVCALYCKFSFIAHHMQRHKVLWGWRQGKEHGARMQWLQLNSVCLYGM